MIGIAELQCKSANDYHDNKIKMIESNLDTQRNTMQKISNQINPNIHTAMVIFIELYSLICAFVFVFGWHFFHRWKKSFFFLFANQVLYCKSPFG